MSSLRKGFHFSPFIIVLFLISCAGAPEKQIDVKTEESQDPLSFYKGPEDVEKALQIMETRDEMDRDSRFIYYSLLISNNDIDKAIEQLKILLSENENDTEVLRAYITLMDYKGDTEERDKFLEKLLSIDSENSFVYNMKGTLALRNEKYKEAEIYFQKSLESDSSNIDSYIGRGNALMHIEGRERESLAAFDRAEKIDPNDPFVYIDRSRVQRFLKDYGKAEDDITKAISLDPSEWNYLDRARIRISDLDDKEGAKEDLKKIISMNSENFFANVYLAGIYDDEKEYDLSLKFYEKILSLANDYYYAYPALGKLYYIKAQWNKAAEMYAKASFSKAKDMTYPLMASLCYTLAGDEQNARSILNDNIGKLDRSSSIYEMYRYFLNPSSPYFVQLAIDKDKNEMLRDRMKFYLAMVDKNNGFKDTAAIILNEIAGRKGAYEFELAAHELEN